MKDEELATQLLERGFLPDQHSINEACLVFGRKHEIVLNMCSMVCTFIKNKQQCIKHVWPSYRYVRNDNIDPRFVNDITFVIITQTEVHVNVESINMFNTFIRASSEISSESRAINKHENTFSRKLGRDMKRKRKEIMKCMDDNVDKLLEKHSNITTVSASLFKSSNYTEGNENFEENLCIVLYVHVKGYIPLNEDPFPLNIEKYDVDVRECVFTPLTSSPKDFHSTLKMGLEIGITGPNGKLGTIGYLDPPYKPNHFVTCAHVVMDNDELVRSKEREIDIDINVYQPLADRSRQICGRAIKTVYQEKGRNDVGVEAALVKIVDRDSNGFTFPHSDVLEKLSNCF